MMNIPLRGLFLRVTARKSLGNFSFCRDGILCCPWRVQILKLIFWNDKQ